MQVFLELTVTLRYEEIKIKRQNVVLLRYNVMLRYDHSANEARGFKR